MVYWFTIFLILFICGSSKSHSWNRGMATWDHKRETNKPTGCIYYKFQCADEVCIEKAKNLLSSLVCPPIDYHCETGTTGKYECKGRSICVDSSEKLSRKCPTLEEVYIPADNCSEAQFQCKNGNCINEDELCNGKQDCTDGSDEVAKICYYHFCPLSAFRCAYGGCVSASSRCNSVIDCIDRSDETEALCGKAPPEIESLGRAHIPPGSCAIPDINNGLVMSPVTNEIYSVSDYAVNGERLVFECPDRYLVGNNETYCINGALLLEPPRCKRKNFSCGKITRASPLISGGKETHISRVPWHVGIYELQMGKYTQICGGTIISQTAILSAAHCFWDEANNKAKDVNSLAVLAGKTNRDYYVADPGMQTFQVKEIHIPEGYYGKEGLYVGDIAVLRLNTSINYKTFIRPVCTVPYYGPVDKTVRHGTYGRVAGWGLNEHHVHGPILKVIDLEAVDYETCKNNNHDDVQYVTTDKFCASRLSENVCTGDSGGGFAEPIKRKDGQIRFTLKGLVSVGLRVPETGKCAAIRTYTTFTNVLFYDYFVFKFTQEHTNE